MIDVNKIIEYSKVKKELIVEVHGISMMPLLKNGECIKVVNQVDYEKGDILLFPYKGIILVHRLIFKDGELYILKGDNAFQIERIYKNNIIGKVWGIKLSDRWIDQCAIDQSKDILADFSISVYQNFVKMKDKKELIRHKCYREMYSLLCQIRLTLEEGA